jgi:mannose-6-phosphate isomerase-like protein (cupin superfamily)
MDVAQHHSFFAMGKIPLEFVVAENPGEAALDLARI